MAAFYIFLCMIITAVYTFRVCILFIGFRDEIKKNKRRNVSYALYDYHYLYEKFKVFDVILMVVFFPGILLFPIWLYIIMEWISSNQGRGILDILNSNVKVKR